VEQGSNLLPLAHLLAVNELNNWWSTSRALQEHNLLVDHLITLGSPLLTSSCRNDIRWSYHQTRCEHAAVCLCVLVACLSRDCPPFVDHTTTWFGQKTRFIFGSLFYGLVGSELAFFTSPRRGLSQKVAVLILCTSKCSAPAVPMRTSKPPQIWHAGSSNDQGRSHKEARRLNWPEAFSRAQWAPFPEL
jgi:hypothetical protein